MRCLGIFILVFIRSFVAYTQELNILSKTQWLQLSYSARLIKSYEACPYDSVKLLGYQSRMTDKHLVTAYIKNTSVNIVAISTQSDIGILILSHSCLGFYPVNIRIPMRVSHQYPHGYLNPGDIFQSSDTVLAISGQKLFKPDDFYGQWQYESNYFVGKTEASILRNAMHYESTRQFEISRPSKVKPSANLMVQGTVKDYFRNLPLEAEVMVRNSITKDVFLKTQNNSDGNYTLFLPMEAIYDIEISSPGFNKARKTYNLLNKYKYERDKFDANLCKEIDFSVNLYDNELFFPVDADIVISDSSGNKMNMSRTDPGRYSRKLPIQKKYKVIVKKPLYVPYEFELNLGNELMYFELVKNIDLKPKKKEVILDINDAHSKNGVAVNMRLKNMDTDEDLEVNVDMIRDGKLSLNLREGNRYKIDIAGQNGYAYYNSRITLDSVGESGFITIDKEHRIYLLKLETGAQLLLKDIVFEYKSSVLKDESLEEVKRVINLLKVYPNLVIEIGAHTDDVGSDNFNLELSRKRALYVSDFILSHNTSYHQLQVKGYGEAKPVAANDSEQNREKNRRLELTVISNN